MTVECLNDKLREISLSLPARLADLNCIMNDDKDAVLISAGGKYLRISYSHIDNDRWDVIMRAVGILMGDEENVSCWLS